MGHFLSIPYQFSGLVNCSDHFGPFAIIFSGAYSNFPRFLISRVILSSIHPAVCSLRYDRFAGRLGPMGVVCYCSYRARRV